MFSGTLSPVASAAKSILQKGFAAARSPFFHVNNPSDTLQPSVVSIPVSNAEAELPADNASKFPVSFADVLKSKPGSLKGRIKSVVPVSATATASAATTSVLDAVDPPIKNLIGKRRGSTLASAAEPPVVGVITQDRSSRRKQPPTIVPTSAATLVPAPAARPSYASVVKTKRDANRTSIRPEPVVRPLTPEQEKELLKEQIKKQFLKEHAEEAKAKKDFIEKEKEIVEKILEQPERAAEAMSASTARQPTISKLSMDAIMTRVQEIKEHEKQEKTEVMAQEMAMQGKRRRVAAMEATELLQSGEDARVDASIPVFQDYTPKQIADFILRQFPHDAISVLDNFKSLTIHAKKEILDFIILKSKAVTLNAPNDAPGPADDVYNKLGIKSLSLPGNMFTGIPPTAGIISSSKALLVCQVNPCAPASEWCCCLSSGDSDFIEIAELIKGQSLPFVTANPDIKSMRVNVGAGGNDPQGFVDPFPSVIIGDQKIVYSIGPILDAESVLGRALIMIRIHNYKNQDYPNGIYFWVYPSFSEGGANRVFLTIGNGQFIKGPDYTLTTFILDLLQVHINKYYTKHFVNKQGAFRPTILTTKEHVICFFGGMIHLQTLRVHDLIEGRGLNLGPINPLEPVPVPVDFNRHSYKFDDALPMKTWLRSGIPSINQTSLTNTYIQNKFLDENETYTGQRVYNSFPLSCCLTTIFHKYRDVTDVNNFFALCKRWPDTRFVQGCHIVPGVSPVGCVVAGTSSNLAGMKYNAFLEHLAPFEIVKKIKSLRLVPPIVTPEFDVPYSMIPRMGRNGILVRKLISGVEIDVTETCLMVVDLDDAAAEIRNLERKGEMVYDNAKAEFIFKSLPSALQKTITKISEEVFYVPVVITGREPKPLPPSLLLPEQLEQLQKVQLCFKNFLGLGPYINFREYDDLIMRSVRIGDDKNIPSIAIVKDSPLYMLIRILESGVYRHLIMSSMLDEYTGMKSYPLSILPERESQLSPRVSCAFLNGDGQYVELPGGYGEGSLGNCDFSGIFQHPSFNPYIFSATRSSMTFNDRTLEGYISDPSRVNAYKAQSQANISVKVHNKMFLLRLIFSTNTPTKTNAIQIIVCVSSTICIASPDVVGPYISFGVDVQFNVVSIGPVDVDAQGGSTRASILATMNDYLSLGCMGAAKKGEYSKTSGHPQFLYCLDDYFRTIMTECFTYVSAYISPFNCGKDLIMKHFGRVFDVNPISDAIQDAIRGLWDWFPYLQQVQPDVCSPTGVITDPMIEKAITSGRQNMQMVVGVFFDPIMEQEDARLVREFNDSYSDTGSMSSSSGRSSSSESSATSSVGSSGSNESKRLFQRLVDDDSFKNTQGSLEDSWVKNNDSRESMSSTSSRGSFAPAPGPGPAINMTDSTGGTNKKTRKYKTNRRSKSKSKLKPKHTNIRRRIRTRTRKNTQVSKTKIKTKTKTMKIKSKKFPKRIYLYSTPRTAQRMAYKYLGRIKTAKLYPARNPAKKYMVYDPKNNKWVNFGQMGYEDYTKHHDKTRRKNYLTRTKGMLGDWKSNKYSANNLSRSILWG